MFGFQGHSFDAIRLLELGSYAKPEDAQSENTIATSGQWCFHIKRTATFTETECVALVSLWDQLPGGETARCHLPGFAFQLMLEEQAVFIAALCWQCNNASIGGSLASESWRTFDASADSAIKLLSLCQNAIERT